MNRIQQICTEIAEYERMVASRAQIKWQHFGNRVQSESELQATEQLMAHMEIIAMRKRTYTVLSVEIWIATRSK